MRRSLPALACLLALLVPLSGCELGDEVVATARRGASAAASEEAARQSGSASSGSGGSSSGGASAQRSAAPAPAPQSTTDPAPVTPPAPTTRQTRAYDVRALQRQLTELKYYRGAVDGRPGAATRSALMAFQKVHSLSADAVVGPATRAALRNPRTPQLRGGTADRVEVDLTRQVLYLVQGGTLEQVLPVSSGNGATYAQRSGGTAVALTPTGHFTIERRVSGVRRADLGTLYDPQYFYRGWALHGSDSVPAYPASHGCVRLTRADARWLLDKVDVGTSVDLYGGAHVFSAGSSAPRTDSPSGDTQAG